MNEGLSTLSRQGLNRFSQLNRRSFLASLAYISLASIVSGCQPKSQNVLSIQALKKSVPRALIQAFQREIRGSLALNFDFVAQRQDCFDLLQKWQREARQSESNPSALPPEESRSPLFSRQYRPSVEPPPSLCQLGHYWLDRAIALDTIAPLDHLEPVWTQLAGRSPFEWSYRPPFPAVNPVNPTDPTEIEPRIASRSLWGVPYRWSSTAIAYRTDKLGDWQPRDWRDLWENPKLRGRIVLPDSPREVIGLVLKSLGASYNTENPGEHLTHIQEVTAILKALNAQVLTYSSTEYQQALILGDAWVAVGSSQDIAMMPEYGRTVAAVVPESGTALWADLWVQPRVSADQDNAERDAIARRWIEFCWQPDVATTLSLTSGAASPGLFALERDQLPAQLREDALVLPAESVLAKSEFLRPLASPDAAERYRQLWRTMRSL